VGSLIRSCGTLRSPLSGVGAYLSVRFLRMYFQTQACNSDSSTKEHRMTLELVLVVLFLALCVSGIFMWVRLVAANKRTIDVPAGEFEQFFWGGVMCRHLITSGTLARLEFFDWGVRLRGIPISRWIVPTWEARYDELAIADLVALPQSRIAVWLRLRDESTAIAFLSDRTSQILPVFEQHGVPVSRTVTKIRRVEELYR
jgi:hypothetical protein